MTDKDSILVTGAAGFIGFHLSSRLLAEGYSVSGVDSINDYYDVGLKEDRLSLLQKHAKFEFTQLNLAHDVPIKDLFANNRFKYVIHLAAQAGVRYSLTHPQAYVESNLTAFVNILEACRHQGVEHLVFASSSSVYGANGVMPFSVKHNVDHPISLYAATKKSNELMAHTYAANFSLPVTGLRFFTVYGPWGRPDMALFLFTKAILNGDPIDVYNNGEMRRDFTYVDDIVEGIQRVMNNPAVPDSSWNAASPDPSASFAPFKVYNIGNSAPVELMHFIKVIEKEVGKKATINYMPIQTGDVPETYADVSSLVRDLDYQPAVSVEYGVSQFIKWYREYYRI
ncbi:MAG: NAD-dependent epimerase [Bacteroidota bacterium]